MPEGDKFFLFIGDADREGVTSFLKAAETPFIKKRLESGVDNWNAIIELLSSANLLGVVVKLNHTSYRNLVAETHREVADRLLSVVQTVEHVIFMHESFFDDQVESPIGPKTFEESVEDMSFEPLSSDVATKVSDLFDKFALNIVPYRTNAQLSVMAMSFIERHEKNLIFRVYVPNGRMWEAEVLKLIQLFRDYLVRVSGVPVREGTFKTKQGVVFEFFGDGVDANLLSEEFNEFSSFLELCVSDPNAATSKLTSKNFNQIQIADIVSRFAKEGRRLQVDIRQERERKILSIRHRMESELVDALGYSGDEAVIAALVDSTVPNVSRMGGVLSLTGSGSNASTTININPQLIGVVNGVVANAISGNQHLGDSALKLLALINTHGGSKVADLTNALHEIEDPETKPADKLSAGSKLKGFLYKLGGKGLDIASGVLQSYIETKLGI